MTVPALNVYANKPRVFFRDTERSNFDARRTSASKWKTIWDTVILPGADTYKAQSASTVAAAQEVHARIMALAVAAWLLEWSGGVQTRPAGGYADKAILAAVAIGGLGAPSDNYYKRHRLYGLAIAFDVLYSVMTSTERSVIAAEIIQQVDTMAMQPDEQMDGWSENDTSAAFAGLIAVYGYSGQASAAATRLTQRLQFLFGAGTTDGRVQMERWHHGDGGSDKGGWYTILGSHGMIWSLLAIQKGTDLDVVAQEAAWASRVWEGYLWTSEFGPYDDLAPQGDASKISNPKFQREHRQLWATMIGLYPGTGVGEDQGGQILRALFDTWDTYTTQHVEKQIWNFISFDPEAVPPLAPEAATTPPSPSRLFDPPGIYYHRNVTRGSGDSRWHRDQSSVTRIAATKWYWLGHHHLDAGAVRMNYKGDPLLLSPAGQYDDYSGVHHVNAYQRSWLQSCVPLIYDPGAVYKRFSQTVVNDGGQHFRKFPGFVAPASESDPNWVYAMQNDAGGQAWLRCEDFHISDEVLDSHVYLFANIREAYRQKYTDPHRCPTLECKYLVIEPTAANGLDESALLVYIRIVKANSSWAAQIPFHFTKAFTGTSYGGHVPGFFNVGRLWIDVRGISNFDVVNVPPGTPLDASGYGPQQFAIGGVGTTYPPLAAVGSRYQPDLKVHSMYLRPKAAQLEERFAFLLTKGPTAGSHPAAGATWATDAAEPDWIALTLGSTTYRLHKTLDLAVVGSPDTTAPAEVTGQTVEARDRALLTRWTDPADSDYDHAEVWFRTSAT